MNVKQLIESVANGVDPRKAISLSACRDEINESHYDKLHVPHELSDKAGKLKKIYMTICHKFSVDPYDRPVDKQVEDLALPEVGIEEFEDNAGYPAKMVYLRFSDWGKLLKPENKFDHARGLIREIDNSESTYHNGVATFYIPDFRLR